jgi:hypothetical protein
MNWYAATLFKKRYRSNPHAAYVPKSLGYRNNQRNLIRLCNQPGAATRAFVTTSTGEPGFLSHLAGNGLRQTISIVDLRADLWIANIGPSNPRSGKCKSMAIP